MLSSIFFGANGTIAACYFITGLLIFQGLKQSPQPFSQHRLVVATTAIFFSCALGHGMHVVFMAADAKNSLPLMSLQVGFDSLTALVAIVYLALRRHYTMLIDGPLLLDQARNQLARANLELTEVNANLESLVAERTAQLQQKNQELIREIKERQQAQEALAKAYDNLEYIVQERTAQLWQANQALKAEIAERQQVELALRQSESTLRSFFDSAPMMMGVVEVIDDDILHISNNPIATKFFGLSPEQMRQRLASSIGVPQEYICMWLARYRQAADTQAPVAFEYPHQIAGEQKWLRATVCCIATDTGTHSRFAYVVEDITDRRLVEERIVRLNAELEQRVIERTAELEVANQLKGELLVQEQKLRASTINILESISDVFFALDKEWRFTYLNHKGEQLLGRSRQELLGAIVWQVLPETVNNKFCTECYRAARQFKTIRYEAFYLPARAWMEVRIYPGVDGISVYLQDISDRKLAEQQIQALNQDLERRVANRTAQLEAANKELEAFSYSVSHDLRAPLRSIDGFSLSLLERYGEQLDEKGKHYLQRVRAGCQRMGELIDSLLYLARMTRMQMQCQTVNLSAIVEAIATELTHSQPERHVTFTIAPQVLARGDLNLLKIVLENLINNAWKFTLNKANACIEFGVLSESDSETTCFVRDNGAGFDMTYVEKLFAAFQRLHTTNEFPGNGIGLATVQRIIHRHGGHIWAEGIVEQGAKFYFTLPSS